jgi:hypothetical protein
MIASYPSAASLQVDEQRGRVAVGEGGAAAPGRVSLGRMRIVVVQPEVRLNRMSLEALAEQD